MGFQIGVAVSDMPVEAECILAGVQKSSQVFETFMDADRRRFRRFRAVVTGTWAGRTRSPGFAAPGRQNSGIVNVIVRELTYGYMVRQDVGISGGSFALESR